MTIEGAERLKRLQGALRSGEPLEADDAEPLALGLDQYFQAGVPLDVAWGLKPEPGHRSARTELARQERDRWIREAAARYFEGATIREAARQIAEDLARYHASGWKRDASLPECPERYRGRLRECSWNILRANRGSLSEGAVRRILGGY